MNPLQDVSPEGLQKILDEHAKCMDVVYFFQNHITGKPVDPETRKLIRRQQQMDATLKRLKNLNRVSASE